MRRVVLVVGCAFVLASALAACSTSGPTPKASTSPGRTPASSVPTETFSSAALGVSFRYPAAWRAATPGLVVTGDSGGVTFRGPSGEVGVGVTFIRSAKHASALPFGNADSRDLSNQRSRTGEKILHSELVTIHGLRLVEVETVGSAAPGVPAWHFMQLSSAGLGGNLNMLGASLLHVEVACPALRWPAQRSTFLAILDSMRFVRPKG